ncbi:MAG: DUF262 domain-containing protein [Campylobacterota bacterium]|nr:DUF262 domain-containing protein [Campylobacterota bacterium]
MSIIKNNPLQNATIMKMYAEKDEINLNPDYQRMGGVWSLEKKQLLIDSIINNYDIPKIYFHELTNSSTYHSSVIDGRQRLETIWEFMDDKFTLADDFKYFKDDSKKLNSLAYSDISDKYKKIIIDFDSVTLPIILVQTDDIDLIEDMFSRLNEAVPLNASEKRNAIGGDAVIGIRNIASSDFFTKKIKVNNSRYQHLEIAVKLLYLEDCLKNNTNIIDTSKSFLDKFVKKYKKDELSIIKQYLNNTLSVLSYLNNIFIDKDILLKRQGDIPIYYLLIKDALKQNLLTNITRETLVRFQQAVSEINKKSTETLREDDYLYYDYHLNSQQGTNNSSNIRTRVKLLETYFNIDYSKSLINIQKEIN